MARNVVIAGGGASGLVAAIYAARAGANVTVIEHKESVGKKILATGNGKCNMTNLSGFEGKYHSSGKESLNRIYGTLERFDADDTIRFFAGLGLCTRQKRDGGIYPGSEQAAIVAQVLETECGRLGVKIMTDCDVKKISDHEVCYIRYNKGDRSSGRRESIGYDKLVLAMGGKAGKSTGSDGSGYYFASMIGHSIVEPLPALVQLKCGQGGFKEIAGVRAQVILKLYVDGELTASEEGELQITDYGISGIPVFQISSIVSRALYEHKKCTVKVNFLTGTANNEYMPRISEFPDKTVEELISGMVHKKLAAFICRRNNIWDNETVGQFRDKQIASVIDQLANFEVDITDTNGFDNAQVCSGGVPLDEVDENFRSLINDDIYIVGELLDCDGVCGGYNLQWAWATGAIAGESAGGEEETYD